MNRRAAVAIVNYRTAQDVVDLVEAISDEYPELPIVVIDNASLANDLEILGRHSPPITELISAVSNRGYGAGANIALQWAADNSVKRLWLLNPDTKPQPGAFTSLLDHFGPSVMAASAQFSGSPPHFEYYVSAASRRKGVERPFICSGCDDKYHSVDIVSGASILLDVDQALHVGGFDERYFHYKEEYDLVSRLVANGEEARLICSSKVWHRRGGSLSTRSTSALYYMVRNEILFMKKQGTIISSLDVFKHPRLLIASLRWTLNTWRAGAPLLATVSALAAGYGDGNKGLCGPWINGQR